MESKLDGSCTSFVSRHRICLRRSISYPLFELLCSYLELYRNLDKRIFFGNVNTNIAKNIRKRKKNEDIVCLSVVQEDWVLCRVFYKSKPDQDMIEATTYSTSQFPFEAAAGAAGAAPSSYCLLPNHVEFVPGDNSNGLLPWEMSMEEAGLRSYGVGDANAQEMKYEMIENTNQNGFPFNYFIA